MAVPIRSREKSSPGPLDPLPVARGIAVGRTLFGLLMLLAPTALVARSAREAEVPGSLVWMCRALGIRDLVLGSTALVALSDPEPDPRWVAAGAASDTCDAAAAVIWREELGVGGLVGTLALTAPTALCGWWASRQLAR